MAGALEPLGGVAERDAAAEVDALAVEGDEATLRRVGGDVGGNLGGSRGLALEDHQPEEAVGVEDRVPALGKLRPHGLGVADGDLGAEAAAAPRPQVVERGQGEVEEADGDSGEIGTVDELAAGDAGSLVTGAPGPGRALDDGARNGSRRGLG